MIPTQVTISELYESVWKMPLRSLAEKWQFTPYALGKFLDKLTIPRPPNGYWTKKALGKGTAVPPLPDALSPTQLIDLTPLQRSIGATDKRKAVPLQTPKKSLNFYPLLKGIEASLSKSSYQYDFILTQAHDDSRVLRLDVSFMQKDRAIGILHALLSAFDDRGWVVKVDKHRYERRLVNTVTVNDINIQFRLRERLIQVKRELSAKEKLDKANNKWVWREKINVPSGRLQLYIDRPMPKGFKSVFEDRESLPLENQLGTFVEHLIVCSAHCRRLAEEQRMRELEWQAEQSRRAEFEAAVKAERLRIELLLEMVKKWQLANQCRKFVSEVLSSNQFAGCDADYLNKWQTWSEGIAGAIDPLNSTELKHQVEHVQSISEAIFLGAISKLR